MTRLTRLAQPRAWARAGRLAVNRVLGGSVILCYHRVTRLASDPQQLAVTPEHFAEHLQVLRTGASPVRLADLAPEGGRVRRGQVAVTFDDGYADNLFQAKPLLEQHDVPATFFLTSGFIGAAREFFWDELERLVLLPQSLPAVVRLRLGGPIRQWETATAGADAPAAPAGRRAVIYADLCELFRPLDDGDRRAVLSELAELVGAPPFGRETHRTLGEREAVELSRCRLAEIGAHTATHPLLSALPPDRQRVEIGQSRRALEALVGARVSSFAYPFGWRGTFSHVTEAALKAAGFARACTTWGETVGVASGRFRLHRFLVRDWDGDEFARRLRLFFRR